MAATWRLRFQVWRHTVGQPQQADQLLFTEWDELFWLDIYKTCAPLLPAARLSTRKHTPQSSTPSLDWSVSFNIGSPVHTSL